MRSPTSSHSFTSQVLQALEAWQGAWDPPPPLPRIILLPRYSKDSKRGREREILQPPPPLPHIILSPRYSKHSKRGRKREIPDPRYLTLFLSPRYSKHSNPTPAPSHYFTPRFVQREILQPPPPLPHIISLPRYSKHSKRGRERMEQDEDELLYGCIKNIVGFMVALDVDHKNIAKLISRLEGGCGERVFVIRIHSELYMLHYSMFMLKQEWFITCRITRLSRSWVLYIEDRGVLTTAVR